MTARTHDQIDELHAVPPAEFTRARDALAAALRKSGDAANAAKVRQLRKPSVAVWAVNRLARDAPEAVARFVDAVERLRRAQLGRSGDLSEATATQRRAFHELQRRVPGVLGEAGVRPSPALERRISGTLLGAATDRRVRPDLQHGRLTAELPPPGLDALLGGGTLRLVPKPTAAPREPSPKVSAPPREDTAAAGHRAQRAAEREERRAMGTARREARAQKRQAIELERAATAQRRAAEAAERSARQIRERLSRAEAEAAAKRQAADEGAAAAARAREEAQRAADAAVAAKRRS